MKAGAQGPIELHEELRPPGGAKLRHFKLLTGMVNAAVFTWLFR